MLNRSSFVVPAVAVALGLAVIVVGISPQVRAGKPPPVTFLDPLSVREAGRTIALPVRAVDGARLVEPDGPAGAPSPRVIAASPDGRAVVVTTRDLGQVGPLTIARADGSQLEVALPGVRGAVFDPSGTWVAAVDLAGALWRADAQTGSATRLANGPYGSAPAVLADGRILVIRLASVHAPAWAAAMTVDPASGAETPVTPSVDMQDDLVYQANPLSDGSVALVRHRTGGGVAVVRVRPDGSEAPIRDLDQVSPVALSPDATWIVWAASGRVWIAASSPDAVVRDLGAGNGARFSPDGSLLLVFAPDGAQIVDLDGNLVAEAGLSACWLGDGRGCQP